MREIKFRLRIGNKILGYEQWYIGDGGNSHWEYLKVNDTVWRPDFIYHTQKDQYTGLKDKNDKEIYEGDIIKYQSQDIVSKNKSTVFGQIAFSEGAFLVTQDLEDEDVTQYLRYIHSGCSLFREHEEINTIEIIGNIYKNPELLK